MADPPRSPPKIRTVRAIVDLRHQVHEGQNLFALPAAEGIVGPCEGQMDGTPCGQGCVCRAGEPWFDEESLVKLGFRPDTGD